MQGAGKELDGSKQISLLKEKYYLQGEKKIVK